MFDRDTSLTDLDDSEGMEIVAKLTQMSKKELKVIVDKNDLGDLVQMCEGLIKLRKAMHNMVKQTEKALLTLCDDTVTQEYLRNELLAIGDPNTPKDPKELMAHFKPIETSRHPAKDYAKQAAGAKTAAEGYVGLMEMYKKVKKLVSRLNKYKKEKQAESQKTTTATLAAPVGTLFQPAPAAQGQQEPSLVTPQPPKAKIRA